MKYEHFKIEDFLVDEQFLEWVRTPDKDTERFWKQWMQSHPEKKKTIALARELILSMEFNVPRPSDREYQQVLNNVLRSRVSMYNTGPQWTLRTSLNKKMSYFSKIAAAIMVMAISTLALKYFSGNENAENDSQISFILKRNPAGQKSEMLLPDGTRVWLNAQSQITYQMNFNDSIRRVELEGEAFFKVAKEVNRPFIVKAGEVTTKALGTSFNINLLKEEVQVSLVSGKVEVSDNKRKLLLNPGEQAIYARKENGLEKVEYDYKKDVAWKDGLLYFEKADFEEVKGALERWYGVEVKVKNKPETSWNYNGSFQNQSLEMVLDRLSYTKGFTYHLKNKSVKIIFNH